ncbi:MAG TPA: Rieske 2Fe-2S domain-containing protein [Candidatus Binataceae bacterium]|nr:Rieske 2Fe-2S domain-containing protein [Candidatus Binataceae bacterium]
MPAKQRNRAKLKPPAVDKARRRKTSEGVPPRFFVIRTEQLKPGESSKFMLPMGGVNEECFIVNYRGAFHAYVNQCRHVPMAMDWVENQFFTEDGRYLMCQTHCAFYEPETGECVAGPNSACGKFLLRIPLEISDGRVLACPPKQQAETRI